MLNNGGVLSGGVGLGQQSASRDQMYANQGLTGTAVEDAQSVFGQWINSTAELRNRITLELEHAHGQLHDVQARITMLSDMLRLTDETMKRIQEPRPPAAPTPPYSR